MIASLIPCVTALLKIMQTLLQSSIFPYIVVVVDCLDYMLNIQMLTFRLTTYICSEMALDGIRLS